LKKHKHTISLKGFAIKNGTIPFSLLQQIVETLSNVAGGTLRLLIDGHSHKRGKHPEWLERSIDFELSALKPGSTILEIQAPQLKDSMGQAQLPMRFESFDMDTLWEASAIDLSMLTFDQAFDEEGEMFLLDKPLLKDMQRLKNIFDSNDASFTISGKGKKLILQKEKFKKIKQLESRTAPSRKAILTGKFDLMKHSSSLMEIVVDNKKIRAFLTNDISFADVREYFGEEVTIEGIAHFNPKGQIGSFEVQKARPASQSDDYFRKIPSPVYEQLQLSGITYDQAYKGTNLDKITGKWPGKDSIDDLLELLD